MKRRELILASSAVLLVGCEDTGKKEGASAAGPAASQTPAKQPQELLRDQVQLLVNKKKQKNLAPAATSYQITPAQEVVEAQVLAAMVFATDAPSSTDLKSGKKSARFAKLPDGVFNALSAAAKDPNYSFDFTVGVLKDTLRLLSNHVNVAVGNASADDGDIYPDPGNPESCASKATLDKVQGLLT